LFQCEKFASNCIHFFDGKKKISRNFFDLFPELIEDEKMLVFNRLSNKIVGIFDFIEEDHTIFNLII
jgi:chromosomal replication initiation ATPase DnaA